jgi:NADH dehydrogenase FAD-containing subunit
VQRGLAVRFGRVLGGADGLVFADGTHLPADCIIAASGARPPVWLSNSKLRLDADGFVAVVGDHRSVSHFDVFAAGDVCRRIDRDMERSGVHAVRAGPVLAHNVLATLAGRATAAYTPRRNSLYLLATRPGHAVVSWGRWSGQGAWVWRWKDWIDRRFIRKYSRSQPRLGIVKPAEDQGHATG